MNKTIKGTELATKTLEVLENGTLRIVETGKYIPKEGDTFWVYEYDLDSAEIYSFEGDEFDILIVRNNLVFRTEEECEDFREYFNLLTTQSFKPDFKNLEQDKFFIAYNHVLGEIGIVEGVDNFIQLEAHYFPSRDEALKFVKIFGETAIKRYMFDIWT